MRLFKSHPRSALFFILYLGWWAWVIYRFVTFSHVSIENKSALFALIIGTISISGIYILMLTYKILTSKGQTQTDYCIFLALITIPMIVGFFYLMK